MEEATELTTASKLKNIFAVVIMVLAVLKALILALTLFHVPVLGGSSYEALTARAPASRSCFWAMWVFTDPGWKYASAWDCWLP